jgi:hypothetical protein
MVVGDCQAPATTFKTNQSWVEFVGSSLVSEFTEWRIRSPVCPIDLERGNTVQIQLVEPSLVMVGIPIGSVTLAGTNFSADAGQADGLT